MTGWPMFFPPSSSSKSYHSSFFLSQFTSLGLFLFLSEPFLAPPPLSHILILYFHFPPSFSFMFSLFDVFSPTGVIWYTLPKLPVVNMMAWSGWIEGPVVFLGKKFIPLWVPDILSPLPVHFLCNHFILLMQKWWMKSNHGIFVQPGVKSHNLHTLGYSDFDLFCENRKRWGKSRWQI